MNTVSKHFRRVNEERHPEYKGTRYPRAYPGAKIARAAAQKRITKRS